MFLLVVIILHNDYNFEKKFNYQYKFQEHGFFVTQPRLINVNIKYKRDNAQTPETPAGKFAEKAVCRSVFLSKWRCISNADSTKTHSYSVTF